MQNIKRFGRAHCSYVFWFGDLNFRLSGDDTPNAVEALVKRDRLEQLIARDQLSMIRRQGRAFTQMEERLPEFPPTFKFDHGSSDYDLKCVEMPPPLFVTENHVKKAFPA